MPDGLHSHNYIGITTYNDGHVHRYSGMTSLTADTSGHVHAMMGDTSFNDSHIHHYALNTGPGIQVDRGHNHYYQAVTSYNDLHVHYLYGYTTVYILEKYSYFILNE